jgi:hypothetical protein
MPKGPEACRKTMNEAPSPTHPQRLPHLVLWAFAP